MQLQAKCKLGSEARSVFIVKVRSVKIYSVSWFGSFGADVGMGVVGAQGFSYMFLFSPHKEHFPEI